MQRVSRLLFAGFLLCLCASGAAHAADAGAAAREPRAQALDLGRLPLAFEANLGQFDRRVRFLARGRSETAFVTDEGLVLVRAAAKSSERVALRFKFEGAKRRGRLEGVDTLPGRSNYFLGNKPSRWHTDVPHYARVVRRGAYRDIDIAYYQGRHGIEYDLIVAPGADPSQVRLAIEGADSVELAENGDLVLHTPLGDVRQHEPFVYQGARDAPEVVDGRYRLVAHGGRTEVRFELGAYDPDRALVLDPTVDFATFFGGVGDDYINGVALDANDDIYIAGDTNSDAATFPETAGAYQTIKGASYDGFVAKVRASGMELVYATYIGGNSLDNANGIAVDANGQAAIGGDTISTNYPTANAVQGTKPSTGTVAVVTKLNAAGNGLVFSTYLGGSTGAVQVFAIAADGQLGTYVTGRVNNASDFPTSMGAFQTSFPPFVAFSDNSFVVKYAANGARVYSTLLAANGERGNSIAVDGSGSAYVVGTTNFAPAINGTAFTTIGPGGNGDAMVAKLNANGTGLAYLTRVGSSDVEEGTGGAVDANGNLFFVGRSFYGLMAGTNSDLPSTPAAPKNTNVALFGALNAAGTALTGPGLTWYGNATATSGTCDAFGAYGKSIALAPSQNVAYIAGLGCPASKFPVVNPPPGLGCAPNCNSDTNLTNSFAVRYSYSPPAAKPQNTDEMAKVATLAPTVDWSTGIAGASGTYSYIYWLAANRMADLVIGGGTNAALGTKDAMDPNPDTTVEDSYFLKLIQKQEIKITKTFEPASILSGGSTVVAIKVENPNALDEVRNARVIDAFPSLLEPEWNPYGLRGIQSDTPVGCNEKLQLVLAPIGDKAVIGNTFSVTNQGLVVLYGTGPTLPPGFVCTVRYVVYDEGILARVETNQASVETENAGAATSSADLTITKPPEFTWSGAGANNLMSNPANWVGNVVPTDGADLVFPNLAAQYSVTNDLAIGFNDVIVGDGGYTFTGNLYTLSAALVSSGATVYGTLFAPGTLNFVVEIGSLGDVEFSGGFNLTAGSTIYVANEGMGVITGPIGFEGGNLTFGGPGLTRMSGTHTGTAGSIGVGDANLEIDANYQPVPLTIGVPGTASGSGSVGAVTNMGTLKAGSNAAPYASFGAATYQGSGSESVVSVNAQAAGAKAPPSLHPDAVATGTSSKLMVTGQATLDGTLEVVFDAPPAQGASYVVLTASPVVGRFTQSRAIPGNVFGDLSYSGTTVTYTVALTTGIFRDGFE